ncbi:hypothetical protein HYC85_018697 [Camellia sinensis]|uniref:Germin-like protein n=1 Tax=Camellia sinensis TaxID=4442 RepID=A0A7J7GVC2_CAMSI|nr:hypothetical protein HYC85_018697 [Camellia sinensis]
MLGDGVAGLNWVRSWLGFGSDCSRLEEEECFSVAVYQSAMEGAVWVSEKRRLQQEGGSVTGGCVSGSGAVYQCVGLKSGLFGYVAQVNITGCGRAAQVESTVLVNGLACRNPSIVQANDFFFSGLHMAGNTSNAVGFKVTPVSVAKIPGLNTLGVSMVRIDYAPMGINPPHTHPRATEILTVLEGSLEVGFVTSNPNNRLISKVLQKGDVCVFPINLIHFQRNAGNGNVVSIAALSSQNLGVNTIANVVFGAKPDISTDVLAKAFQLDKNIVANIQSKF